MTVWFVAVWLEYWTIKRGWTCVRTSEKMEYHGDTVPEAAVDTLVQRVTGAALLYGQYNV